MIRLFSARLCTVSVLACAPVVARPSATEDLTAFLAEVRSKHRVPAIAAAVVRCDGLVAIGVEGWRAVRSKRAVAANDRFHIGSCTKSMTATLCAMLVEQGKLKWDTTVADAFPELKERLDPKLRDVTLKQFLCHRSGLPDDHRPDLATWPKVLMLSGELPDRRRSLVEIVMSRAPAHEPDSQFAYSNYGFAIAGAMCEAATGESYERLLRSRLFEPLNMKSAGFGAPGAVGPDAPIDQPRGHDSLFGIYIPLIPGPGADNPPVIAPAGTVHCSIGDWASYATLHLAAARGRARLLKPETFERLHDDGYGQEYAFGWIIRSEDWAGGKILAHDGSNGRWYAVILIAPQADIAILVATNAGDETAQRACRTAIRGLRERFMGATTIRRSE